jgi:hypothetical protein
MNITLLFYLYFVIHARDKEYFFVLIKCKIVIYYCGNTKFTLKTLFFAIRYLFDINSFFISSVYYTYSFLCILHSVVILFRCDWLILSHFPDICFKGSTSDL